MSDDVSAWRRFFVTAVWVAALTVVVLAGFRGALMDSGLGNGVEFAAGALSGLVAVAIALLLVRLLIAMSARAPDALLVYLIAVLLALVFLVSHSPAEVWRTVVDTEGWTWPYTLPNGLATESLVVLVLGVAFLAGVVALMVRRALAHDGACGARGLANSHRRFYGSGGGRCRRAGERWFRPVSCRTSSVPRRSTVDGRASHRKPGGAWARRRSNLHLRCWGERAPTGIR